MAYTVRISTRFKKDFKRCMKRGLNMKLITDAMDLLEATGTLPAEYKPHLLKGDRKGQWASSISHHPSNDTNQFPVTRKYHFS